MKPGAKWTWKRTNIGPIIEEGDASVAMVYAPGPESGAKTLRESERIQVERADLLSAAPELLDLVRRWKADLEGTTPEFNDPAANELLARIGGA